MSQNPSSRRNYSLIGNNNNSNSTAINVDNSNDNAEVLNSDETATSSSSIARRLQRGPYSRLSNHDDDYQDSNANLNNAEEDSLSNRDLTNTNTVAKTPVATISHPLQSTNNDSTVNTGNDTTQNTGEPMTVTILDFTQQKFPVEIYTGWTVKDLKEKGALVHKVAPDLQRLVYRGKLLENDQVLSELGNGGLIAGSIVHLFPKPRVIIKDNNGSVATNNEANTSGNDATNGNSTTVESSSTGGARIPTIVMDAQEAQQRSSILVLGSVEFTEAQNNVKLFSFMLLMISTIELVTLLAIASGAPEEANEAGLPIEGDDVFSPPYGNNDDGRYPTPASDGGNATGGDDAVIYEHWQTRHYFDLIISVMGVYVALIGIRASNEHTLHLARRYLYGVVLTAIGWMLYNYAVTYQVDAQVAQQQHANMSESDLRQEALSMMILPGMVWFLCIIRAWHLKRLLQEAEVEAAERLGAQSAFNNASPASNDGVDEEIGIMA